MLFYDKLDNISISEDTAVCIGNFDGLHLGHRLIISSLKEEAKKLGLKTLILSFCPHPVQFFGGGLKLISTDRKRMSLFESQEVDYLVYLDFNTYLAGLSPEEFFKKILIDELHGKLVLVGNDYRFGAKKSGDINTLHELGLKYGIRTIFIDKVKDSNNIEISSTRIRNLIISGDVYYAGKLLGCPYSLEGIVVHGDKNGRKLGYPTMNIESANQLTAKDGVYAAKVKIFDKIYNSMAYIGERPTIDNNLKRRVEANLFDFNQEVYGSFAEIYLYKYIRDDMKFNTLDELKEQLKKDKEQCIEVLSHIDL